MSFPAMSPKVLVAGPFGNADPAGSKEFTIFYTEYNPIEIVKAYITNDAAVAANNTNYLQIALESGTTNAGGTELFEMDSRAAHENGIVAGDMEPLNETEGTVARNQYITLTATEGGDSRITDMMLIMYYVEGSPASEGI